MDTAAAFKPGGRTVAISAPTSAPVVGVQLPGPDAGDVAILAYNPGPNLVWLAYGNTAADAQTNAVAPVAGTPQYVVALPPLAQETYTFNAKTFYSTLAITGVQLVYLTPGQGTMG